MPTKLRAWFDTPYHPELDRQDATLQRAFAVVIYHVISADQVETDKEKQRFNAFFKTDFGLNDEQVSQLHDEASKFNGDFETYLEVLQEKLADFPGVELRLMRALNSMMTSHKFEPREYAAFERIRDALFPKV